MPYVTPEPESFDKFDEPRLLMERLLKTHLIEFDLSLRILFPLEKAGIRTLGDLVKHDRRSIRAIPQLGRNAQHILTSLLFNLGLTFGMK